MAINKYKILLSNFLLFFCLTSLTLAGDPFTIQGDTKVATGKLVRLNVANAPADSGVLWDITPEDKADIEEMDGGKLIFTGPPGKYTVKATAIRLENGKIKFVRSRVVVTIGNPVPVPPGPGPNPPGPNPPGPVTSFHVFLVFESGATYTKEQTATLYSTKVADYLDSLPNGTKSWRRFDKDTNTTNDDPTINALWTAVKPKLTSIPCVVIEVNTKADILPLPESPDALITLLKKYRGQ